jgi:hypothetical protein
MHKVQCVLLLPTSLADIPPSIHFAHLDAHLLPSSVPSATKGMSTLDGVKGTLCNEQQYQQSLPGPNNPNPSISCLSPGKCIGLAVSILLIHLEPKLNLPTVNGRGILHQSRLCNGHPYFDWCMSDPLSCLNLV